MLAAGAFTLRQVYAPGIDTGYAAQFLPGIRDALDAGDDATVTTYRDLLFDSPAGPTP